MEFLRKAACLWETQRALVQMNASSGTSREDVRLHLPKDGQQCGRAVAGSGLGRSEAPGILGVKWTWRFVALSQHVLGKARGAAFVPWRNLGRVLYVCAQPFSRGASNAFWRF